MHDLIAWCASVRAALASLHPSAPWVVLAILAGAFDFEYDGTNYYGSVVALNAS